MYDQELWGALARLMPRLPRLTLSKIWPEEEFTGPKLFYLAYASSKLCKFISEDLQGKHLRKSRQHLGNDPNFVNSPISR